MNSIIINVGDEILDGDIVNTNSQYISKELKNIDIEIEKIYVIKDNIKSIVKTIKDSLIESDIIILTGGLGPTDDDMTREGVSKALNYKLYLDNDLLDRIKSLIEKNNYIMTQNNIKQAYRIKNSIIIKNNNGTAPGMLVKKNDKMIFLLPGPPKELKPMFKYIVDNYLKDRSNKKIYTKTVKTIGIGESKLEEIIKPYFKKEIKIGTYAHGGIIDIKVSSSNSTLSKSKENVIDFLNSININKYIWGYNDDTLESVTFNLLKKYNLDIGFAESLTGGLISSNFTKLPGVSKVFPLGLVTYSNSSKVELLGVNPLTLENHGAVSEKISLEMSEGLINKYKLDISLSITGIAGPTGGSDEKPIGLVYIGISNKDKSTSKKFIFKGDRLNIQNKSYINALNELRKFILKNYR